MDEALKALETLSVLLSTGANGAICLIGYTVFKHELRITRLEGRNDK